MRPLFSSKRGLLFLCSILAGAQLAQGQLTVSLETSLPSGQAVGTRVELLAEVTGASELPVYQFAVLPAGGEWRVLRDFSIWRRFDWTTLDQGSYTLRVIATAPTTGEAAYDVASFVITPRAVDNPLVTATDHPLVALYSTPACGGGLIRVRFKPIGEVGWQTTNAKPCAFRSANFYLAGMRANTTYWVQQQWIVSGTIIGGPFLVFHTGIPEVPFETFTVSQPPDSRTSTEDPILLLSNVGGGESEKNFPVALDLDGNVVWYYADLGNSNQDGAVITRPLPGGNQLIIMRQGVGGQILREIDLAGNVVRETNAPHVSTQLIEMGHDPIGAFHHGAIRLPNGHTAVIASVERTLTDVQGPGDVNVYGEMIVSLDENFQVTWAWNGFDHLDTSRLAILGETCISDGPGCPPLFNGERANDWLHANSLYYSMGDGSLLMSLRHQDWVIKVDYADGAGSGNVLWRLGKEGDFQMISGDPWPWFSHQHDANIVAGLVVVYDNGNTRVTLGAPGNSRGQVIALDETRWQAMLVGNYDLGDYSFALGSAQVLSNGNLHFDNGFLTSPPDATAQSIELSGDGMSRYAIDVSGSVYRSFRLSDMYGPAALIGPFGRRSYVDGTDHPGREKY